MNVQTKRKIDQLMKKPLSDQEIMNLVNNKAKFVIYPQLYKMKHVDEALGPYGACFILYETSENYGHWVCLIKQKNKLEFFDPYSAKPDDEIKQIPEYFREVSHQNYPHLSVLLYNSGYPIEYNHTKLQEKRSDISTCGRHVACRINNRNMPLNEYVKALTSQKGLTPDQVVTIITSKT
jgi:hypothetical protein